MDKQFQTIHELMEQFGRSGEVHWIGVRPDRRVGLTSVDFVEAIAEFGLEGDHYQKKGGNRQVTLIQYEHLNTVGSYLDKSTIDPGQTRRNIVTRGINLLALKDKKFLVGEVMLEYSGECHPCSRMEENLGNGGYNAMRGHGGITAKVLLGGRISVGDQVKPILEK